MTVWGLYGVKDDHSKTEVIRLVDSVGDNDIRVHSEKLKQTFAVNNNVYRCNVSVFLVDVPSECQRLYQGEIPQLTWSSTNEITGLDWKTHDEALAKMDIDHEHTDHIVCPYCGCKQTDLFDIDGAYEEDETRIDCQKCDQEFSSVCSIIYSFTTYTVDLEAEERQRVEDKARRDKQLAERLVECQKFTPGTRVRIKADFLHMRYLTGLKGPLIGKVDICELCKINPVVSVILDCPKDHDFHSTVVCFPEKIEKI